MRLMVDGMSERAAAKAVGYEGHHSAMHRYWKGKINADGTKGRWGIKDYTGFNDAETKVERLKAINELVRNDLGKYKAHFTDGELEVFAATVTLFGDFGFPFDPLTFQELCQNTARNKLQDGYASGLLKGSLKDYLESDGGDIPNCGPCFFTRYFSIRFNNVKSLCDVSSYRRSPPRLVYRLLRLTAFARGTRS